MAILLDKDTKVVIQGITGGVGSSSAKAMLEYGTNIPAGVTPGKGGQEVHGIPVYNSVKEAKEAHDINASFVVVPPMFAKSAVLEALDNDIKLVLVFTENVPLHDAAEMISKSREKNATLIGPASVGMLSPEFGRIGPVGGPLDQVEKVYKKGPVGIISKSGGMTNETAWVIRQAGFGQSTVVGMGGEMLVGSVYVDFLRMFEQDKDTKAVVIFGEVGGTYEEQIVEILKNKEFTKPIIGFIGGKFVEQMPSGVQFGHAGALIERGKGKPSEKMDLLRKAGVIIAESHHDLGNKLREIL